MASGNYSSRFSGVGAGAVALAAEKLAAKIAAIREHLGDESLSLRRVAGIAHWHPDALPPGMEISISTDYSLFIIDDIDEMKQSLILGVILTALVSFAWLGWQIETAREGEVGQEPQPGSAQPGQPATAPA